MKQEGRPRNFNVMREVSSEVSALMRGTTFSEEHRMRWGTRRLIRKSERVTARITNARGKDDFVSLDDLATREGTSRMEAAEACHGVFTDQRTIAVLTFIGKDRAGREVGSVCLMKQNAEEVLGRKIR